jgi:hypothetical protein
LAVRAAAVGPQLGGDLRDLPFADLLCGKAVAEAFELGVVDREVERPAGVSDPR